MSNGQSQCSCCKAWWVKFWLTQSLGCGQQKARAKVCVVNDERQFWQGEDPDSLDQGFDVWNLECSDCKAPYVFQGDEKDVGLACLDESKPGEDRYRIVHLWRSTERVLMVKAIDFIKPGDTDKWVQPMKWDPEVRCSVEDTSKSP